MDKTFEVLAGNEKDEFIRYQWKRLSIMSRYPGLLKFCERQNTFIRMKRFDLAEEESTVLNSVMIASNCTE